MASKCAQRPTRQPHLADVAVKLTTPSGMLPLEAVRAAQLVMRGQGHMRRSSLLTTLGRGGHSSLRGPHHAPGAMLMIQAMLILIIRAVTRGKVAGTASFSLGLLLTPCEMPRHAPLPL